MKYYIIAGEASGDLHGANLVKNIIKNDPGADIRAWGGDKMDNAGAEVIKHYKDLAIMGFIEVLSHLKTIRNNFRFIKKDIIDFKPDVLITIDFPGFNLRLSKWTFKKNVKHIHYISPNVWAWKKNRVYSMRKYLDSLIVILPFETDFYKKYNMDVIYEGHPLLDAVENFKPAPKNELINNKNNINKEIVAVLPGSRKQEISRMLPLMLNLTKKYPDYVFLIAAAPAIDKDFYEKFIEADYKNVEIVYNATYDILSYAKAGMITSGTATLEAALFDVPQVVCYKTSPATFNIARLFVKIRRFSLVNLILEKDVVTELIQFLLTQETLELEFSQVVEDTKKRDRILNAYIHLKNKLGENGVSDRIARKIINMIK